MYFYNTQLVESLEEEARSWINTPFRANSCEKNIGVDCVQLTCFLYRQTGFLRSNVIPKVYNTDEPIHSKESKILEVIEHAIGWNRFEETNKAIPGSLLLFRIGRSVGHTAVTLKSGFFVHVLDPLGVQIGHISTAPFYAQRHHIHLVRILNPLADV